MSVEKTFIVAEAGVNHNGSLHKALELVEAAAFAGADAVKFQTYKSELVISRGAAKAAYQKLTTSASDTQLEMVKKLELSREEHWRLIEHCAKHKIAFLSTPFDEPSAAFLIDELKLLQIKIPSGEITNPLLLLAIAGRGVKVILSTGMCTLGEIEQALGVLAYGYLSQKGSLPSTREFASAFRSDAGQAVLRHNVVLLHCTTEYPAPIEETNLRAIASMRAAFGLSVGYSDHTEGIAVSVAAVALGAAIIEKHLTLDRNLPGPDHKASIEPEQFCDLVRSVRSVEMAFGNGVKRPQTSELKNIEIARKSLVASTPIKQGELFSSENISVKRPGSGISPMQYWEFIGKTATRDYDIDDLL